MEDITDEEFNETILVIRETMIEKSRELAKRANKGDKEAINKLREINARLRYMDQEQEQDDEEEGEDCSSSDDE
jgi:hypothetical protein